MKTKILLILAVILLSSSYSGAIVPGDVNGDNDVNLVDAIITLQLNSGYESSSILYPESDIGGDGKLGLEEAVYGLQVVAGIRTVLQPNTDWTSVSPGAVHTVAIKKDGTLYAWGHNGYGQFGDGTLVNKNTPTKIGTDADWHLLRLVLITQSP